MCIICYGIALIASIAVALAVYGLSLLGWCYLSRQRTSRTVGEKSFGSMRLQPYLYSTFKYRKGVEDGAKDESAPEMDCAVCLTGFEDGEDVKQLPRCKHSFHAPCIDMWLYSHSDCPLCRSSVDRRDPYSEENSNSQVAMLNITIST